MQINNKIKIFTLALFIFGFVNTEAATLNFSPSSISVSQGQTFSVDIMLDTQGAAIDGVDIYSLRYNQSVLEVVDSNSSSSGIQITPGNLLSVTLTNTVNQSNGTIQFSQVTTGGTTYNGSGKLATITFRGISGGTSSITIDYSPGSTSDSNIAGGGQDKLSGVGSGSYTVGGSSGTTQTQTTSQTQTQTQTQTQNTSQTQTSNQNTNQTVSTQTSKTSPTKVISTISSKDIVNVPGAPKISSLYIALSTSTAIISWKTNEPADSQVEYGLDQNYGMSSNRTTELLSSHQKTLSGLSPDTKYHFRVRSVNSNGKLGSSQDQVFVTKKIATKSFFDRLIETIISWFLR